MKREDIFKYAKKIRETKDFSFLMTNDFNDFLNTIIKNYECPLNEKEIAETIETIEIASAEVEWDYPLDYSIAFDNAIKVLKTQL